MNTKRTITKNTIDTLKSCLDNLQTLKVSYDTLCNNLEMLESNSLAFKELCLASDSRMDLLDCLDTISNLIETTFQVYNKLTNAEKLRHKLTSMNKIAAKNLLYFVGQLNSVGVPVRNFGIRTVTDDVFDSAANVVESGEVSHIFIHFDLKDSVILSISTAIEINKPVYKFIIHHNGETHATFNITDTVWGKEAAEGVKNWLGKLIEN